MSPKATERFARWTQEILKDSKPAAALVPTTPKLNRKLLLFPTAEDLASKHGETSAKLQQIEMAKLWTRVSACYDISCSTLRELARYEYQRFFIVSTWKQQNLASSRKSRLQLSDDQATPYLFKTCWFTHPNLSDYIRQIVGLSHGDIAQRKCFKTRAFV